MTATQVYGSKTCSTYLDRCAWFGSVVICTFWSAAFLFWSHNLINIGMSKFAYCALTIWSWRAEKPCWIFRLISLRYINQNIVIILLFVQQEVASIAYTSWITRIVVIIIRINVVLYGFNIALWNISLGFSRAYNTHVFSAIIMSTRHLAFKISCMNNKLVMIAYFSSDFMSSFILRSVINNISAFSQKKYWNQSTTHWWTWIIQHMER